MSEFISGLAALVVLLTIVSLVIYWVAFCIGSGLAAAGVA